VRKPLPEPKCYASLRATVGVAVAPGVEVTPQILSPESFGPEFEALGGAQQLLSRRGRTAESSELPEV
jgi:hypothetical protein